MTNDTQDTLDLSASTVVRDLIRNYCSTRAIQEPNNYESVGEAVYVIMQYTGMTFDDLAARLTGMTATNLRKIQSNKARITWPQCEELSLVAADFDYPKLVHYLHLMSLKLKRTLPATRGRPKNLEPGDTNWGF